MTVTPTSAQWWPHWIRDVRSNLVGFRSIPPHVRDELCQEALVRLLCEEHIENPGAWLRVAVRRLAIDWVRRSRRAELHLDQQTDTDALWPDGFWLSDEGWEVSVLEARHTLRRALHLLETAPALHREVLLAEAEERPRPSDPLERDRHYKRRNRAVAWLVARMEAL